MSGPSEHFAQTKEGQEFLRNFEARIWGNRFPGHLRAHGVLVGTRGFWYRFRPTAGEKHARRHGKS